jgi:hypothetical protein
MQLIYISQDGDVVPVGFDNRKTLNVLQTLVDGSVDCVEIGVGFDLWVNDEGLFRNDFQTNLIASVLVNRRIVGPAVIATQHNGETLGVTDHGITLLRNWGIPVEDEVLTVEQAAAMLSQSITL